MKTDVIPRQEWEAFFEGFSREYEGWLVTLEVTPPVKVFTAKLGDRIEAEYLALGGLAAELNNDGEDRIEVMVGEKPDDHITHNVIAPTEVRLDRTEQGADVSLKIRAADGTVTWLRILAPVLPETVDGVVAESHA